MFLLYCKNQYGYALFFQVLAGMNVYSAEFERIKEEYNVRGYPTICYFESVMFCYYFRNHTLNYNCMFLSSRARTKPCFVALTGKESSCSTLRTMVLLQQT